ncbi:MAG: hypothetical protein ACI8PZ_005423 [Myxococcota bacterium]
MFGWLLLDKHFAALTPRTSRWRSGAGPREPGSHPDVEAAPAAAVVDEHPAVRSAERTLSGATTLHHFCTSTNKNAA